MTGFIVFVSSGLLVYWSSRTLLLLKGSEEQIDDALDCDLWWGRQLLISIRAMLSPPAQMAG